MALTDIDKELLGMVAKDIPEFPPLKPGGDLSVKDMYPDLSQEELDYLYSKYKGTMRKE